MEMMAHLVPLTVINTKWVSDISGAILFLILFISTRSKTFEGWLIRHCGMLIEFNCTYFCWVLQYTLTF